MYILCEFTFGVYASSCGLPYILKKYKYTPAVRSKILSKNICKLCVIFLRMSLKLRPSLTGYATYRIHLIK